MKAVRLHAFHQQPTVDEVSEPVIGGPLDVMVKIGGAAVCGTDLHIIEGQWDAASSNCPHRLARQSRDRPWGTV
jgi:NAD+-dependent secondary alcohol dehydrogenase Adh1